MKTKIFLLIQLYVFFTGCASVKYVYIQNKTGHDIQIYTTDIYDVGQDSIAKIIMKKNNLYNNYEKGKLTMRYHKILKNDSLAILDVVYGKKSKTELVDSKSNYFKSPFVIISNADTIQYFQKKTIQKINEVWLKRNINSSIKLKSCEKTRLIWEFKDSPAPRCP